MVGMSGKTSEPRRGQSSQPRRQGSGPPPASKPKPPVEALQMAKILGDSSPSDLQERVQQVKSIVPTASDMEVSLALHDNDYDPERAISALLDSDGKGAQSEWTTSSRKGKKKSQSEPELIVAPGDQKTRGGPKTGRGTSKAAPQAIRESYGGSVQVTSDAVKGGRGGERGQRKVQSSGRTWSSGGRRGDKPRLPGRPSAGRGVVVSESKERPRAREAGGRPRPSGTAGLSGDSTPPIPTGNEATPPPALTDMWDDGEQTLAAGGEVWGAELPPPPSATTLHALSSSPDWVIVDASEVPPEAHLTSSWDEPAVSSTVGLTTTSDLGPMFPEAIPSHPLSLLPVISAAETTSAAVTSTSARQEAASEPPSTSENVLEVGVPPPQQTGRRKQRHKRIARSQIPTMPVEMPDTDSLDVEFGSLGIDFLGLESAAKEDRPQPTPSTPPSSSPAPTSVATAAVLPHFEPTTAQLKDPSLLTYTGAHFVDPLPSALLQYQAAPQPTPESTPTKLDAPPGLTHPNIQPEKKAPLLPAPLGLPQSHPSPPHTSTEVAMATAPPSQPSPRSALEPAHLPLPPIPHSIEMPASTATPITGQATQYSTPMQTYSISSGISTSGADMLLNSSPAHPPQSRSAQQSHVATSTTLTNSTGTKASLSQLQGSSKQSQLAHGVMYPPMSMMHQYPPFIPMVQPVSPAYYGATDPEQVNRFPVSAYYPQHATTSDPNFVASSITRDHAPSGFLGEGSKFNRGSSDVTSPVSSNQQLHSVQQQQQQSLQGQQLGAAAYVNPAAAAASYYATGMMYHPAVYGPPHMGVPGYSSQMGPKPSVGSSYPVSSYQPGPSPGSFPYEDMTSAAGHDYHGKHFGSSSVGKATPTTGSSDAAFKHYESKSNASYGYPANMHVPGGSAGGYMGTGFMQVPGMAVPLPMVQHGHDTAQNPRGQMQKHAGKSTYMSQGPFWPVN